VAAVLRVTRFRLCEEEEEQAKACWAACWAACLVVTAAEDLAMAAAPMATVAQAASGVAAFAGTKPEPRVARKERVVAAGLGRAKPAGVAEEVAAAVVAAAMEVVVAVAAVATVAAEGAGVGSAVAARMTARRGLTHTGSAN
jgi:hypothetical protein